MMPLHVGKFERFPSADRNELALAALEWCRAARASAGVKDSRFYWIDPNEIVVVTDAEPGAWGPGAGAEVSPQAAKAIFALADLARNTSTETWADARAGERRLTRAATTGYRSSDATCSVRVWPRSPNQLTSSATMSRRRR